MRCQQGLPLWVLSFAIGWGGICVHFQILSSISGIPIGMPRFMLFRLFHGLLAGGSPLASVSFFRGSAGLWQHNRALHGVLMGSVPAAVAIVGLCILLCFNAGRTTESKLQSNSGIFAEILL